MHTIGEHTVCVHDDRGVLHSFLPGDPVPDWAVAMMGEHCFATARHRLTEPPTGAVDRPSAPPRAPTAPASESSSTVPQPGSSGPPPQAGPDAGRDVWADYATVNGITVPADAKRGQIITACRDAGIPV